MRTYNETFGNMQAVRLTGGGYTAVVIPQMGANCISLSKDGHSLLRTPPDEEALKNNPNVYGLPVLFPPNRIRDGQFVFNGCSYVFPINEPARHHHIHGFLSSTPFVQTGDGAFTFSADSSHPYISFPHAFTMTRTYLLDENGMTITISVSNNSNAPMPLGVGIHAAWQSEGDACRLKIPVKQEWLLNRDTIIPTGETCLHSPLLESLRAGVCAPNGQALSNLLELDKGNISLKNESGTFVFTPDPAMRFIMLWNGGGTQGFVCPEPQNWLVDAPNLPLPPSVSGFEWLLPGMSRTFCMHYAFL